MLPFKREGANMSVSTQIDYAAMLADLEAKKASIDTIIASVRAAMALGALGGATEGSGLNPSMGPPLPNGGKVDIPSNMFTNMSIPDAAKLYLSMVNRKQTSKEIAAALQEGGMHTTAKDFLVTVNSGLFRAKAKSGEIVRVQDAWGLAAWYKGLRAGAQEKPEKKKAKTKKTRKARRTEKPSPVASQTAPPGTPLKPQEAIERYLAAHPDYIDPKQIANALNMRVQTVILILSKLANAGQLHKAEDGTFHSLDTITDA
jgi:hypothetical protein